MLPPPTSSSTLTTRGITSKLDGCGIRQGVYSHRRVCIHVAGVSVSVNVTQNVQRHTWGVSRVREAGLWGIRV